MYIACPALRAVPSTGFPYVTTPLSALQSFPLLPAWPGFSLGVEMQGGRGGSHSESDGPIKAGLLSAYLLPPQLTARGQSCGFPRS